MDFKALDLVINEFIQLFEKQESEILETHNKKNEETAASVLASKEPFGNDEKGSDFNEQINSYIDSVFHREDVLLEEVLSSIKENGMRSISVSPSTGKLLTMLVSISGAKNVLEIGALGGYSGICLARGFGRDGKLTSLELEEGYAKLAHSNLSKAGFGDQVSYITGAALPSLEKLIGDNKRFDFFFIDADKENYENYLRYCIKLAESTDSRI